MRDPIVEEIHKYREEHAGKFNYDLDAIREDRMPRCDVFDGANSTMAALMATEAIAEGKPLRVPVFKR